jgi:hypothetical protein
MGTISAEGSLSNCCRTVAYGEKRTPARENLFDVLTGSDVVPSKPREFFDDDHVDLARLRVLHHPFERGTLEVRPRHILVDISSTMP